MLLEKQNLHSTILHDLHQDIPGLKLVYLFGSTATGQTHAESDVDIAFLSEEAIDNVQRFDIQERIARHLKQDVDLIDLSKASDILKVQVIYGKSLFAISNRFMVEYENRALQDYVDLKEMFNPLLYNISKEEQNHDDILLQKVASIERCIIRVSEELGKGDLQTNFSTQDAIVLNIQRMAQLCIDAGLHLIKQKNWGLPQSSREIFELLEMEGFIDTDLSNQLQKMVGFRNLAIHQYKSINIDIVVSLAEDGFRDIITFKELLLKA